MKLADHLSEEQKKKLRNKFKKQERVNWIDIMGMNKQKLRRKKGGALTN